MTQFSQVSPIAYIYGLTDPRTGQLRYIGKANDPDHRFRGHLRDSHRRKSPVYSWILKLAQSELMPGLIILRATGDWRKAEREEISSARIRGLPLLNLADGGDEPFCPIEVRRENGRKIAQIRHKNIQRIYRGLEYQMRIMKKQGSMEAFDKLVATKAHFALRVAQHRAAGTLDRFDAAFHEAFFKDKPTEKWL